MGWKHAPELHSCRHCVRIVVTRHQLRSGSVQFPHTRSEAILAAEDGCPVFIVIMAEAFLCRRRPFRYWVDQTRESGLLETLKLARDYTFRRRFSFVLGRDASVFFDGATQMGALFKCQLKVLGDEHMGEHLLTPTVLEEEEEEEGGRAGKAAGVSMVQDLNAAQYRVLDNAVDSTGNIAMVKRHLGHCLTSHTMCRVPAVGFAPSRLLEVSPDAGQKRVRLVETDPGSQPTWASLSYVWGTEQPHKTTRSRLSQYMEGISMADLPQTIQDAITVCRMLNVPYLWVDSLCIVQDDVTDKTREIPLMALIYRHSLLTISAACAHSVFDGFLHPRPFCYSYFPPTALVYQGPDGVNRKALALTEASYPYHTHQVADPIESRAWTLQERLLSPRLLTYSSHGLVWSCRALYQHGGDREKLRGRSAQPQQQQQQAASSSPRHPMMPLGADDLASTALAPCIPGLEEMEPWHKVVEQYSHGETSLPSDKLVALAAVAQTYGEGSSAAAEYGTYLAGVWGETVPRGLMWHVQRGRSRRRPASGYRAPSWSWASVDGPVSFVAGVLPRPSMLVRAAVTPAVESIPFGAVVGGAMVLDVNARRCAVSRIDVDPGYLRVVDGPVVGVLEDSVDFWDSVGRGGRRVLLLEINNSGDDQFGLVLVAAGDGAYRRVAVFKWPCSKQMEIDMDFYSTFERDRVTII